MSFQPRQRLTEFRRRAARLFLEKLAELRQSGEIQAPGYLECRHIHIGKTFLRIDDSVVIEPIAGGLSGR